MPDKTLKIHLKVKARKRLQRLAVETSVAPQRVIVRALKALERARLPQEAAAQSPPPPFRVRCEIEGQDTSETLEQLQGLVNEVARWLLAQGVAEAEIPMMLVALGAQCIREGERSQRFVDEQQQARRE